MLFRSKGFGTIISPMKRRCWTRAQMILTAFDLRFRRSDKKSHLDLDIRKFRKWEVVHSCLVISNRRIQRQSLRKMEAGLLVVDFACCCRCIGTQWVRFWRCMGNETLRAIRVSERWSSEVAANMPLNVSCFEYSWSGRTFRTVEGQGRVVDRRVSVFTCWWSKFLLIFMCIDILGEILNLINTIFGI